MKRLYVVYLCGSSNSYNKPMNNDPLPVGVWCGEGRTGRDRQCDAETRARAAGVQTYSGQYLRSRALMSAPAADAEVAYEEMARLGA